MAKNERKIAADLDLIKWQYIRMEEKYRKIFDSIKHLYESVEEFTKDGKSKGTRIRMRRNLSTSELALYDEAKETVRSKWDLAYPINYEDPEPPRISFFKRVPVRRAFDSLPHKLILEIDLTFTRKAIDQGFREAITSYQKAFKAGRSPEKPSLETAKLMSLVYEQREIKKPATPYRDIYKWLEKVYPHYEVEESTLHTWHSRFKDSLKSRSYLKLK